MAKIKIDEIREDRIFSSIVFITKSDTPKLKTTINLIEVLIIR